MKKSIATVCLSGDLRQKIEAAGRAGFDGIEIFENDLMLYHESPAAVRRMAQDQGLEIVALQPFRDFECMPAERMAANFQRAERKFDLMEELGTAALLVCSNVSPQCINDPARAIEDFRELAERAATRGFRVGYEALAWGRHVRDYQQAWDIVNGVDRDNFGIVLDSFHIFARNLDLELLAEIPGDRIAIVQIADAPVLDMDVLQWSRHFRCFPGQGDFPVVNFMKAVAKTGYEGYLSHEIFNDAFRSSPCRPTAADGKRSMIWLEEQVFAGLRNSAGEREPTLPPAPNVEAVEFVEFSAGPDDDQTLIDLMHKVGFRRTHRHRSKDVELYRRGEVCMVVNREPDSYAQYHYLTHGVSVCAVAYRCGDAGDMAVRAEHYGYAVFEGHAENGELNIPAIRGVSGNLHYFVQKDSSGRRFFDIDFESIDPSPQAGQSECGTMGVDHIASGVSESEFLSLSLFYRAFFGLDVAQPQDLIDPYGVVVSRTATSRDGSLRLPFNMTRSWGASTERFREQHKGSGVQHLAIRCDDVMALAREIDASVVLKIPENYYDDIEARFALDPGFTETLKKYNLLYDRDGKGDFFHLYTISINGFFLEFVQRNNDYQGYGEPNAQVRMAAQVRIRRQS